MKTTKTKKPNMFWLRSNKKMFCIILVVMSLLIGFSTKLLAQDNTILGYDALKSITTGQYNTAIGAFSLYKTTSGGYNTANGASALEQNITGTNNVASGINALSGNLTGGYNAAFGVNALMNNTTGSNNSALGAGADVTKGDLTNATAIGYNASVNASNTIQLGNNAVTKVFAGVGKSATLIVGGLQITGGTPAAGKVLTADANGVATWQNPMGGGTGWGLTGNLGTVDGTNFVGTTDNAPFNIRVNNQKAGRIDANNAFYGYQSGNARTTGGYNTANGYQALYANTTGDGNTAIGDRSLLANTIGNYNTAIGSLALNSNIDGKYNTALGYNADVNAGLTNATAIGSAAKATVSNTIQLGDAAVTNIFAGVGNKVNTVTGNLQITGGKISTAAGIALNIEVNNEKAGRIDLNNSFYGYQSGNARTTGGFNTANGYQALYANTTGDGNTAVGSQALRTSTKGNYNTAVGYNADIADKDAAGKDITNATALGHAAWVDESDKVVVGNTGVMTIGGYTSWTTLVSDARFKKNIQKDVHGLDFIMQLKPITYTMDVKKLNTFLGVDERNAKLQQKQSPQENQAIVAKEAIRYNGFLAQEVEQAAQAVNYNFSGVIKPASDKGHYGMSYSDFVVPLVKGMQEQQQMLEAKDAEIKTVKEEQQKINQQLQQQIDELKKLIVGNSSLTKDVTIKQAGTTNAEDISLYPNPTTGICTITTSHIDNGVIEIYDMAGNNLQKTTFNNGKTGYQLNVSGYAKGVYLLNILANNKKYTKRLVIQ